MELKSRKKALRKFSFESRANSYYTLIDSNLCADNAVESWNRLFFSDSYNQLQRELDFVSKHSNAIEDSLNAIKQLNEHVFIDTSSLYSQGTYALETKIGVNDQLSLLENFNTELYLANKKNVFGHFLGSGFNDFLETFDNLIQEYKTCQSENILDSIHLYLAEFETRANEKLIKLRFRAKSIRRKIALLNCNRNLRSCFRHIIQFLFKNMDDESNSGLVVVYKNSIRSRFLNKQKWKHSNKLLMTSIKY